MDRFQKLSWHSFATVKSFDPGSVGENEDCKSTELIGATDVTNRQTAVTTPISLLVQSLIQQLCSVLEKDHNKATKLYHSICEKLHQMKLLDETYAMGEFETMRYQYQRALYQLVSVTSGSEIPVSIQSVHLPMSLTSGFEWSRYCREFEEILFIAGGGFGSVYRAKHRLDGVDYAVKKIRIQSADINSIMNHLSEVKTFAVLDHPNIVAYKAAWLEPYIEHQQASESDPNEEEEDEYLSRSASCDSESIVFRNESSSACIKNEIDKQEENLSTNDDLENCKVLCTMEDSNNHFKFKYQNSHIPKWCTLYIQMSLCQRTLKKWLEERNYNLNQSNPLMCSDKKNSQLPTPLIHSVDKSDMVNCLLSNSHMLIVIDIFTQIAHGLHYIHQCGIVHHDVKPSNIFIDIKKKNIVNVKLGDFGLACPLQNSHKGVALGTQLYAAPEQLEGHCNRKSDLYSLGIILLEMIEIFTTDMEKAITLDKLRKGSIPAYISARYPKLAHIITKLVEKILNKRIDTTKLLQMMEELRENKDETIKELRAELLKKDEEIAKLKKLLSVSHQSREALTAATKHGANLIDVAQDTTHCMDL